jgi:hypothetical protein
MDDQVDIQQPEWTEQDIRAQQRELAALKHLSVEDAYAALDRGEFHGTIFESELSMLRFMLDEEPAPLPHAAE